MSKYTTEVRFICESSVGLVESKGFNDLKNILTQAAPKVFDFDFPIFDEQYRLPLEIKILRHYYTREICEETVGLWKLRLQDRLNMIMPYYNQMYKSELLEFNPLYDVDLNRTHNKKNDGKTDITSDTTANRISHGSNSDTENGEIKDNIHGNTTQTGNSTREDTTHGENAGSANGSKDDTENTTGSGTSNTTTTNKTDDTITTSNKSDTTGSGTVHKTGTAWQLYSDTPQGGVQGINRATDDIANNAFLTNATKNTTDEDTTTSDTTNGTTSGTQTTDGSSNGTSNTETSNTGKRTLNSTTKETTTLTEDSTLNSKENSSANSDSFETRDRTTNTTRQGEQDFTLNDTNNTTGSEKMSSTEDYIEHVAGKQGTMSYSRMLTEFRETFLNIDKLVIDELSDLFFGLW